MFESEQIRNNNSLEILNKQVDSQDQKGSDLSVILVYMKANLGLITFTMVHTISLMGNFWFGVGYLIISGFLMMGSSLLISAADGLDYIGRR